MTYLYDKSYLLFLLTCTVLDCTNSYIHTHTHQTNLQFLGWFSECLQDNVTMLNMSETWIKEITVWDLKMLPHTYISKFYYITIPFYRQINKVMKIHAIILFSPNRWEHLRCGGATRLSQNWNRVSWLLLHDSV